MAKLKREDATVGDGVVLDGATVDASASSVDTTNAGSAPATAPAAKTRKPRTPRDPNAPTVVWSEDKFNAVVEAVQGIADGSIKGGLTPGAILAALKASDAFTPTEVSALTAVKVAGVVKKLRKAYDEALEKGEITAEQHVAIPELERGKTPKLNVPTLVRIAERQNAVA